MDVVWGVLEGLHFNSTAFWSVLSLFVVFHFCMRAIIYDRLLEVRAARDGQLDGRLAEAQKLANQAQQLKSDYESSIRKLREELHLKLEQAIKGAEGEASRHLDVARDEAEKILDQARLELEAEEKRLAGVMEERVNQLAHSIARRLVLENFSSSVQTKLMARIGG